MPAFAVVTQKSRFCHFCSSPLRWYVVEADQINILSFAMLGDFEEIEDTEESRHTCQLGCNVGKPDQFDGVNFDLSLIHAADERVPADAIGFGVSCLVDVIDRYR